MAAAGDGHILHRCRTAHPWQMRARQSQALSWPRTKALGVSAPRPLAGDTCRGFVPAGLRGRSAAVSCPGAEFAACRFLLRLSLILSPPVACSGPGNQLIFWCFHLKPQWGHGWKPLGLGWALWGRQRMEMTPVVLGNFFQPKPGGSTSSWYLSALWQPRAPSAGSAPLPATTARSGCALVPCWGRAAAPAELPTHLPLSQAPSISPAGCHTSACTEEQTTASPAVSQAALRAVGSAAQPGPANLRQRCGCWTTASHRPSPAFREPMGVRIATRKNTRGRTPLLAPPAVTVLHLLERSAVQNRWEATNA